MQKKAHYVLYTPRLFADRITFRVGSGRVETRITIEEALFRRFFSQNDEAPYLVPGIEKKNVGMLFRVTAKLLFSCTWATGFVYRICTFEKIAQNQLSVGGVELSESKELTKTNGASLPYRVSWAIG